MNKIVAVITGDIAKSTDIQIEYRDLLLDSIKAVVKDLSIIESLKIEFLVGDHKDINVKPIKILKHGRRAKSIVKYGLEEISNVLLRPSYTPKFDVFIFLSCT